MKPIHSLKPCRQAPPWKNMNTGRPVSPSPRGRKMSIFW